MSNINLEELKNKDVLVFMPSHDIAIKASIEYTFGDVFMVEDILDQKENERIVEAINQSKAKQIIFINHMNRYMHIIPGIDYKKKIKIVFTNSISSLTNGNIFSTFNGVMELYDRDIVELIGVTDESLYKVLNNAKYNVLPVMLDNTKQKKVFKDKNQSMTIGLLSNDFDPNNNFYNQLSALTMVTYSKVKLMVNMAATEPFMKTFGVNYEVLTDMDEIISNNYVNLYINFTNNNDELVLKSMDMGIPCILGNTSLYDDYPVLKEHLVLKSDDDLNEMAEKINNVDNVRKEIFKEYTKFRKDYSTKAKKLASNFLNK